jgi:hypothetical protein
VAPPILPLRTSKRKPLIDRPFAQRTK